MLWEPLEKGRYERLWKVGGLDESGSHGQEGKDPVWTYSLFWVLGPYRWGWGARVRLREERSGGGWDGLVLQILVH